MLCDQLVENIFTQSSLFFKYFDSNLVRKKTQQKKQKQKQKQKQKPDIQNIFIFVFRALLTTNCTHNNQTSPIHCRNERI